jgi:chromosome segregation ATPase
MHMLKTTKISVGFCCSCLCRDQLAEQLIELIRDNETVDLVCLCNRCAAEISEADSKIRVARRDRLEQNAQLRKLRREHFDLFNRLQSSRADKQQLADRYLQVDEEISQLVLSID